MKWGGDYVMHLMMGWPTFTAYPSLPLGSSGSPAFYCSALQSPGELFKISVQAAHQTNGNRISGGGIQILVFCQHPKRSCCTAKVENLCYTLQSLGPGGNIVTCWQQEIIMLGNKPITLQIALPSGFWALDTVLIIFIILEFDFWPSKVAVDKYPVSVFM